MKDNAERQASLRERRLAYGYTEVRGLYIPTKAHSEVKAEIREVYPLPDAKPVRCDHE